MSEDTQQPSHQAGFDAYHKAVDKAFANYARTVAKEKVKIDLANRDLDRAMKKFKKGLDNLARTHATYLVGTYFTPQALYAYTQYLETLPTSLMRNEMLDHFYALNAALLNRYQESNT